MSFLDGLAGLIGGGIQAFKGNTGMGEREGRLSFEDFNRNQGMQDMASTNQIARDKEFLSELTPAQAGAYNQYQDSTYANDTERQTQRIKDQSSSLGMSPWELTGSGSQVAPVPSYGPPQGGSSSQAAASAAPLLGMQLQSKTQLQIAKINAATQLQTTAMQTGNAMKIANQQTGDGELPRAQIAQARAQAFATEKSGILAETQDGAAKNEQFLNTIRTIATIMPKEGISVLGLSSENNAAWRPLLEAVANAETGGTRDLNTVISETVAKMRRDQFQTVVEDIKNIAAQGARNTAKVGKSFLDGITHLGH